MDKEQSEFEKLIYKELVSLNLGISKSGWIYEDFFKNEISGFEHFLYNFRNDADYKNLKPNLELVEEIAEEINSKIHASNFMSMVQQSSRIR